MSEAARQFSEEDIAEAMAIAKQRQADRQSVVPDFSPQDIVEATEMAKQQMQQRQIGPEPARESRLTMVERMAATRAKDEPERLEGILSKRGFDTKREGDQVLIKQGGKFVPWDPKGMDLGDIADLVPEALQFGVGALAGTAKVAGALSAPVTGPVGLAAASGISGLAGAGLETAMQGAEIAGGFREELNKKDIAVAGAETALVPGLGKVIGAAGKGVAKQVGKAQTKRAAARVKSLNKKADKLDSEKAFAESFDAIIPEQLVQASKVATAKAPQLRSQAQNIIAKQVAKDQAKQAKIPLAFFKKGAEKGLGKAAGQSPKQARIDQVIDTIVDFDEMALKKIFPKHGKKAALALKGLIAATGHPEALIPTPVIREAIKVVGKMTVPQLEKAARATAQAAGTAAQKGAKAGLKAAAEAGKRAGAEARKGAKGLGKALGAEAKRVVTDKDFQLAMTAAGVGAAGGLIGKKLLEK